MMSYLTENSTPANATATLQKNESQRNFQNLKQEVKTFMKLPELQGRNFDVLLLHARVCVSKTNIAIWTQKNIGIDNSFQRVEEKPVSLKALKLTLSLLNLKQMSSIVQIALFCSQSLSASLSLVCSTTIIYKISRSNTKLNSPYSRLIFGLSVYDAISSFANCASSMPIPRDHEPDVWGALGNETSCRIQGFLFLATIVNSPFYNLSLCIYSLCIIKYSMTDKAFSKRIETPLHVIPFIFGSFAAIFTLSMGYINVAGNVCFVGSQSTAKREEKELSKVLLLGIIAIPCGIVFLAIMLIMGVIFCTVWKQEMVMKQYRFTPAITTTTTTTSSTDRPRSLSRRHGKIQAVKSRAFQYFLVYLVTFVPPTIIRFIGRGDYQYSDTPVFLLIMGRFLFPLQGFLNMCVHLHPQIKSIRQSNSEFSYIRGFYLALRTYDDDLDERRQPRYRRMSRRLSQGLQSS